MSYKNSELTAYCGLYCADCIRFKCKASDLSDRLLDEIKKNHFLEYAEVKKNHTKEFEEIKALPTLLEAISKIRYENMVSLTGASLEKNATLGFNVYLRKPNNLDGLAEEQH